MGEKTPNLDRDWLSAKDACAYIGCSFPTLKKYIAEGKLQHSQIVARGKIRISAASIKNLLGVNNATRENLA